MNMRVTTEGRKEREAEAQNASPPTGWCGGSRL